MDVVERRDALDAILKDVSGGDLDGAMKRLESEPDPQFQAAAKGLASEFTGEARRFLSKDESVRLTDAAKFDENRSFIQIIVATLHVGGMLALLLAMFFKPEIAWIIAISWMVATSYTLGIFHMTTEDQAPIPPPSRLRRRVRRKQSEALTAHVLQLRRSLAPQLRTQGI